MVILKGYDAWLERPYYDNDGHYPECEDNHHFLCSCGNFILDGAKSRNWCDYCGKFASRPTVCICERLDYYHSNECRI